MSTDPFETDAVNHILFGTDGSEVRHPGTALVDGDRPLLGGAGHGGVCLRLPQVVSPTRQRSICRRYETRWRQRRRRSSTEAVAEFVAAGLEAEGVVFEGNMEDAILDTAEQIEPDVIVIRGGGREGTRDYLVGSSVERIIRHAAVSVLVIK